MFCSHLTSIKVHLFVFPTCWLWARGGFRGGTAHPARAPPKIGKNMIFFGVKSWFFTWNTPKISRLPLLGAIFLSAPPPPNLKSWIRPCERTWWRLFQRHVHCYITDVLICCVLFTFNFYKGTFICFSNLLIMSVPDEDYSRDTYTVISLMF